MKNYLKQAIKSSKITLGTFITIGHPEVSEVVAGAGLDYVIIDTEHAPLSIETVQVLLQSMSFSRTTPLIRVAWNDPVLVKHALDIGAHGIDFPFVNNREQALAAVRSVRYPPAGVRGYGPRRASLRDQSYVRDANKELMVAVQVESAEAITNLDEIASVPGIDVILVGPDDLSLSLGVFGKKQHPRFKHAIKEVLRACTENGVTPSIYSEEGEVDSWVKEGFRMLLVETDLSLLTKGLQRLVQIRARYH
jgi:4-hydroxy-2-oxoheptanedioate aldolase